MRIPVIAKSFDYWDLRVMNRSDEMIAAEDKTVTSITRDDAVYYGLRVLNSGYWSFASSTKNDLDALFRTALKLSRVKGVKVDLPERKVLKKKYETSYKIDPLTAPLEDKVGMIKELNARTVSLRSEMKTCETRLFSSRIETGFHDSLGSEVLGKKVLTRYFTLGVAAGNGSLQQAVERNYETAGLEVFYDDFDKVPEIVSERAVRLLHAKYAPAKRLPVVCDNQMTGVFFHEAVGHACEADHLLIDASVLKGKVGVKVGSDLINFSDYAGPKHSFGRIDFDDEGVKKTATKLITGGVLQGYLHSLHTAAMLKSKPTGNGRSMTPEHFPIPRMTTLKLEPGDFSNDELVKELKNGVLVKGFRGGEVNPTEGKFIFAASEAFMVENGEVTTPLRDVTISGDILKTMHGMSGVGNKLELNKGGVCGKAGQRAPVDEFMPWTKLDEVIVGGRNA